jgi:hypothetical protein
MSQKLKLNLDVAHLRVESFEPQDAENAGRGTVRGHLDASVDTGYGTCGIYPCKEVP